MMELENFFSKTNKKSVTFRLSETVIKRLKDMGETLDASQAEIIELLVTALYYSEKDENHAPYANLKLFEKVLEMCGERFKENKEKYLADENTIKGFVLEVYIPAMEAAATVVSELFRKTAKIHRPDIEFVKCWGLDSYLAFDGPACGVEIKYVLGLTGNILFVLKQKDIIKIVDIWMGGTGQVDGNEPCGEMHMSAIGELFTQMMGQSSMALQKSLNMQVDATRPTSFAINNNDDYTVGLKADADDIVVVMIFRLVIGDTVDSQMAAIISLPFAKEIAGATVEAIKKPK